MGLQRIAYVCSLAGAAVFYVLYPFWFSWYLLTVLLILFPFDLVLSLPGMLTKRLALFAPRVLEQGTDGALEITTTGRPFLSGRIKARLRMKSDDRSVGHNLLCSAGRGSRHALPFATTHSGFVAFELKRIKTTSLIGFFSIPVPCRQTVRVLILPSPVKPANTVALPRGVILRPKHGGGFSEDHDIREYRLGDPVRSIHWKISAKYDSLVIREPLVPPAHDRLVQIAQWNGARERDLTLGRLRWISDYLLKWELQYYVRLGDSGRIAEISKPGDLVEYLLRVLDSEAEPVPTPPSVPARFSWVFRVDGAEPLDVEVLI